VHACCHHCCGMDKRADRSGAFHSVRQPDVKWELRRLAGGAGEQEERNRGENTMSRCFNGKRGGVPKDRRKVERAKLAEEQEQSQQKTEIADTVHPKRLITRIRGGLL